MPDEEFRYAAFISYRHEPVGRKWATWLHRAIENYRVPKSLQKIRGCPARLGRVFRDEEELSASADLSVEIDKALVESKFLIVICTPRTPHSRWVNQEVQRFRDLGRGDRILALLVEGEPRESFPPSLVEIRREVVDANGSKTESIDTIEPLAADVRDLVGDGKGHVMGQAKQRLIASLLGVAYDDLVRREARRRYARVMVGLVACVATLGIVGGLAAFAFAQRSEAVQQRKLAEEERDTATAVLEFLTEDVLAGARPDRMPDPKLRDEIVNALLKPAANAVVARVGSRPAVLRAVRNALGSTYKSIGRNDLALDQTQRWLDETTSLLGPADSLTLAAARRHGYMLREDGQLGESLALLQDALARAEVLPAEHLEVTAGIRAELGATLRSLGRIQEAEAALRQALRELERMQPRPEARIGAATNELALILGASGRPGDAEVLLRTLLESRKPEGKAASQITLTLMDNLAAMLMREGETAAALATQKEVVEISRQLLGDSHPDTLRAVSNYAAGLRGAKGYDESVQLCEAALQLATKVLAEDHRGIIALRYNLGASLMSQKRYLDAEKPILEALQSSMRALGPTHPSTLHSGSAYAEILVKLKRQSEAELITRRVYELARRFHPSDLELFMDVALGRGKALVFAGRAEEGVEVISVALATAERSSELGPKHAKTRMAAMWLSYSLDTLGRHDDAISVRSRSGIPTPTTFPAVQRSGPALASATNRSDEVSPEVQAVLRQWDAAAVVAPSSQP